MHEANKHIMFEQSHSQVIETKINYIRNCPALPHSSINVYILMPNMCSAPSSVHWLFNVKQFKLYRNSFHGGIRFYSNRTVIINFSHSGIVLHIR